jgi:hypothetical protein
MEQGLSFKLRKLYYIRILVVALQCDFLFPRRLLFRETG